MATKTSHGMRTVSLLCAILLALVGLGGCSWSSEAEASEELREALTVPESAPIAAEASCSDDHYSSNSLATVGGGNNQRRWSDSVSTPFVETDKEGQLKELMGEICRNPTLGDATAAALMSMDFGGNFDIAAANPWLKEFSDGWDAAPGGGLNWLLVNEAGEYFVSPAYQEKAELVNQLLLGFSLIGETERTSAQNWHIAGLTAGALPRASENSQQENLPALLLRFTFKGEGNDGDGDGFPDGNCRRGEYAIGFNLLDKRPEIFNGCQEPEPSKAPKDDDSSPNPTPPDNPPSVTPPPDNPPSDPPVPPTVTQKDPVKDPARQGKAPTGGGKNANPGPGKLTKDPGTAPSSPRVNPAPPKPAETPRTIPVQPAEPRLNPAPAQSSPQDSESQDPPANSGTIEQPDW